MSKKTEKATKKTKQPHEHPKQASKNYLRIIAIVVILFLTGLTGWYLLFRDEKPEFSGENAYQYLLQQTEFGPRNPGSAGHDKCKEFLIEELEKYCDRVGKQEFVYFDKQDSTKKYTGTNIIASTILHPKKRKRIMLCTHWDTRPWADEDPHPENRHEPIIGANDGASGVAVLLEMARVLENVDLDIGVDIILFDLEDMGDHQAQQYPDSLNPFSIGAEYFVRNNTRYRPTFGVLVDMVGDSDLQIKKESYSVVNAKSIINRVWAAAEKVGANAFVDIKGDAVFDDHVPFLKRGIPVINIIDFDYPYWHTMADTPDKCSLESLQQVGDVLLEVILQE